MKPGPKTTYPRSDAQLDQADDWGHEWTFTSRRVPETAPVGSWWTTPRTREEFDDAVKREQPRMTAATGGKFKGVNV